MKEQVRKNSLAKFENVWMKIPNLKAFKYSENPMQTSLF